MLFLSKVERIRYYISFQVASEANLNLASSLQILGFQIRESSPRALSLIGDKVSVFIDSHSSWFAALRSCILGQILWLKDFTDVVIALSATDFAEETQ